MAKEDFCFTYYDGDAARDMSHMNRLERGAYTDIIICQRKFGWLSLDLIKKLLGKDFTECWPAIELVMVFCDGKYYIEWLEASISKAKKQSVHQSENGKKGGRGNKRTESHSKAIQKPTENKIKPLGDGNGDEGENDNERKEVQEETISTTLEDCEHWTKQVIDKTDPGFEVLCINRQLHPNGQLKALADEHLSLCSRYKWHKNFDTQQSFRHSLIDHIQKNLNSNQHETIGTDKRKSKSTLGNKFGSADYSEKL